MQLKPSLKNTIAAVASDGFSRLFGFVTTAYLARVLGTASFGVISIGLSVLGYAVLFSTPGVTTLGMREVARRIDPQLRLVQEITSLRLFLAFIAVMVILCIGALLFGLSGSLLVVVLFSASAVPIALSIEWYFQGENRIDVVAISRVMMYCCYLASVLVLVGSPADLLWAPAAFWIANLVPALWLISVYWKRVGPLKLSWAIGRWWALLKASLPLGLSSLLMQTIVNLPILIAGAMLSAHETGLFSASMKLLFFLLMIDRVFNTLFFPVVSRYRLLDQSQFSRIALLGLKVMIAVSLPIAIISASFSETFTSLVYGPLYYDAADVLRWLVPYFVFTTMNTVLMCIFYADKRDKEVLGILMAGTTALVVLCVVFGFWWRGEGIAAGLTAGEGLITVLLFLKVGITVKLKSITTLGPVGVGGFIMALVIALMRSVNIVVAASVGSLVFFGILFALKGLTPEDIRFLRERFL